GKILATLKEEGLDDNTVVIFTSDHGFHLGEHDFWMKVSLKEESVKVPLMLRVPGMTTGNSEALVELIDLYPTLLDLTGFEIPTGLQGKSLAPILKGKEESVRVFAFSVTQGGNTYLIRTDQWAYIQYGKNAEEGIELFDMYQDPGQFTNLANLAAFQPILLEMQKILAKKITEVRKNNLAITY
ncbi:MAG: sulfatase-like hydrolase/transferase, partial [Cyclobacteriaceae bacterium]|nr:sulfatase-like hydrolase/transferase [Cyclobacteriaceae bacterium]